jgi:hypothetical protein
MNESQHLFAKQIRMLAIIESPHHSFHVGGAFKRQNADHRVATELNLY